MATRDSVDDLLQQCEDALRFAQDQYQDGRMQEHFNDSGYADALSYLENAYNDLTTLAHSANAQQREQLHRMRLQLQQLQNQMIITPH
ncbi:YtzC family protein [Cytobacillus purgationiresistens]|uniref:Polyhydroxyalkanoate synthesis regulator phasin n=1 Tax=Cytobacillus purgationiresistens TaxID=863449 RepID=A0ABU0AQD7_9BACI|nr:YtzC family protein [Cytobacillus purgationiresistens]MDQ0272255.1 polyhydroxyalkanoate synthesis regulator phasin [Cytobacillus purgationiresistens]